MSAASGVPALTTSESQGEVRRLLRLANAQCNYRWRLSYARGIATNHLVGLTLLVSLGITVLRDRAFRSVIDLRIL